MTPKRHPYKKKPDLMGFFVIKTTPKTTPKRHLKRHPPTKTTPLLLHIL